MKVKIYKLKEDYKMFKQGTLFQEIEGKLVVSTEFARCIEKSYFDDFKTDKKFEKIMEKFGTIDIKDTMYYQITVRSYENQVKFAKEKLDALIKIRDSFLQRFN